MKPKLLEILVCPLCKAELSFDRSESTDQEIISGQFTCSQCDRRFPLINGIPRFVEPDNYASSFGYQWNLFRKEQIDSHNGTTLSADRFWSETGWEHEKFNGKWMLDAGCGAGRFLDVSSGTGAEVVGIDISSAIDAAQENLKGRENLHLVQASIYDLPFRPGTFDFCYCIGVLQHTPQPERSLTSVADMVAPGGRIAVTIYERRRWWTRLHSKYWLRPLTKRVSKETLLTAIRKIMPVAFPLTNVLFRIPLLGKAFGFVIPVANYVHEEQLSRKQRYEWAVLDTFDMLSPQFDSPMQEPDASRILAEAGVDEVARLPQPGLNLVGRRSV